MTLQEALEGVEGWFGDEEAQLMHDLASQIRLPQMIVEIGVAWGRSLIAMALGAGVPLFGVDPHNQSEGDPFPFGDNDRQVLMANLVKAGVAWKVRLLDVQSEWAAKGWPGHRIGLLHIDGQHLKEAVEKDLASWLPYVDDGAWVAFHDSNTPCVIEAVKDRTDLEFVQTVGLIGLYRYRKPMTTPEMLEKAVESVNQYAQLVSVEPPDAVLSDEDLRVVDNIVGAMNIPADAFEEPKPDKPPKPPKPKPVVATRPKRKS